MDTVNFVVIIVGWLITIGVCAAQINSNNKRIARENENHIREINHAQDIQMAKITGAFEKNVAVIDNKIDELTKRVEKHNNVVERTYALEKDVTLVSEKLRVANKRIADLEKGENA